MSRFACVQQFTSNKHALGVLGCAFFERPADVDEDATDDEVYEHPVLIAAGRAIVHNNIVSTILLPIAGVLDRVGMLCMHLFLLEVNTSLVLPCALACSAWNTSSKYVLFLSINVYGSSS